MKANKIISSVLSLALFSGGVPPVDVKADGATSAGFCGDYAVWTLEADGTLRIKGSGALNDYETQSMRCSIHSGAVTAEWKSDPVPWYEQRSDIKKIVIEDGIISIGKKIFMDCDNLTEVQLPETLESIGGEAFYHCDKLKEIRIPDSVVNIYSEAFESCGALSNVMLSSSLEKIDYHAFRWTNTKEIVIPESVKEIGVGAFEEAVHLSEVCVLSRDCDIYPNEVNFSNGYSWQDKANVLNAVIYGWEGSTIQAYAEEFGYGFVSMKYGDVDFDSNINALDASLVLSEYSSTSTGNDSLLSNPQKIISDTDLDGNINALDASYILSYYSHTATGGEGTFEEFMK